MAVGQAHLPPLDGAIGWINSDPLTLDGLHGSVVLVDFWTFTCVNWLRTEPYIRTWSRAYREDGLITIGVHTPEFTFEHDIERVRRATKDFDIDYPVAVDSNYAIWTAFDNHYWPAVYLADREGVIRDHHFGEGRYAQTERSIQRLLGIDRNHVDVEIHAIELAADWTNLTSPETYLGFGRGENFSSTSDLGYDEPRTYALPDRLALNHWALSGQWTIRQERATLEAAGGSVAFRFHGRDANLIMLNPADDTIPFRVTLDGTAPGESHGLDVDADGNGSIGDGRLYQLLRQPGDVLDRTLEITFAAAGAEVYCFTFG